MFKLLVLVRVRKFLGVATKNGVMPPINFVDPCRPLTELFSSSTTKIVVGGIFSSQFSLCFKFHHMY